MPIDVLAKITHGYYQLTTAEKKVADYVLLHTWETQYMSISELAEACDVAEATVPLLPETAVFRVQRL